MVFIHLPYGGRHLNKVSAFFFCAIKRANRERKQKAVGPLLGSDTKCVSLSTVYQVKLYVSSMHQMRFNWLEIGIVRVCNEHFKRLSEVAWLRQIRMNTEFAIMS